jgi:predicted RND superfamily exporter protein
MVDTIIISVIWAFLGMLLFTQNLLLALCVFVIVSCVISGLAFFMVVVMQWAIGAIEAMGIVVFVGYSITYSMHIANIFGQQMKQTPLPHGPEISEVCIKAAVFQIGEATLGSATTTLISSFFLLFCTLQVFFRLGIVVLIVTILSAALAVLVLPAVLVVVWLPVMSLFNRLVSCFRRRPPEPACAAEPSYNKESAESTQEGDFEAIVPGRPV